MDRAGGASAFLGVGASGGSIDDLTAMLAGHRRTRLDVGASAIAGSRRAIRCSRFS
jgi:hypothetical protein